MRRVVFLPHLGEFGWFIVRYIRRVHQFAADEKVVCCLKGQEIYFPSAVDFYYDWEYPIAEQDRRGIGNQYESHAPIVALRERLRAECADYEIIPNENFPPFTKIPNAPEWMAKTFVLSPQVRGLKVDLVFGARMRSKVETHQNWDGWKRLAEAVTRAGYSFAVVGRRGSTQELAGAKYHSWDFSNASADVELLQNCRLYVGGNSGVSHLATFLQAPTIVVAAGRPGGEFLEYMRYSTRGYFAHLPNKQHDHVIERVLTYLRENIIV